jgi:MFS family permease
MRSRARAVVSAWRERPHAVRQIAFLTLVDATGTGLFLTASIVIFTRLVGIPGAEVGFILTVAGLGSLAAAIPAGLLVDRFGPRPVLIGICLWRACGLLAYCWSHDLVSFVVVTCVLAVADRASPPVTQTLVAAVVGAPRRVTTMAEMRALRNVGFAVGALLAGLALAADTHGAYVAILAGDAASFLVVVVVLARLEVPASTPTEPTRTRAESGHAAIALRDRPFITATLLNAVLSLHMTLLTVGIPLWVIEHTTAPRVILGPLVAMNAAIAVALQVRASRDSSTVAGAARALYRAGLSLAACCVLLAPAPFVLPALGWPLPVLLVLATIALTAAELWQSAGGWGVSYALAPAQLRGTYLATFNMGVTAQQVFGPALIATLIIPAGTRGWLGLAGALLAVTLLVPRLLGRLDGDAPPPEPEWVGGTTFSGQLTAVGLLPLLDFLGAVGASGALRLAADGVGGSLSLVNGRPIGATFGSVEGPAALEAIGLVLSKSRFEFVEHDAGEANLELGSMLVFFQLAHLGRERERLRASTCLPLLSAVPRRSPPGVAPTHPVTLGPDALQLLLAIDDRRTVAELLADRPPAATFRQLAELAGLRLLEFAPCHDGIGTSAEIIV